jgi:prophage antirepressor-like protein
MNELQIFNYNGNEVRTVQKDGEPWWILKDVCGVLGLKNPTMIAERLEDDEVTKLNLGGLSGETNIINESGLYNVILRSDKPEAKPFRRWVTGEVLPSIRKTGSYTLPQTTDGKIALLAQGHMELKAEVDEIKTDLEMLKMDLPLLPIEADKITEVVRRKGVYLLGGKQSEAYSNRSLRQKLYNNIYSNLKYQFGVKSYKSIKRSQCDTAIQLVDEYRPPYFLSEQINQMNRQVNML